MHEIINWLWPAGTTLLVIAGLILGGGACRLVAILAHDPRLDDGGRANKWLRTGAAVGAFVAWLARGEVQLPAWTWVLVLALLAWAFTDRSHGGRTRTILRRSGHQLRIYAEIAGTWLTIVVLFIAFPLWMACLGVCRLARLVNRHRRVVLATLAAIGVWIAAAEIRFVGYHLLACLLGAWMGFEAHPFVRPRINRYAGRLITWRHSVIGGAFAGVFIASLCWHAGVTIRLAWLSLLAPAAAASLRALAQHPSSESARRWVAIGLGHTAAASVGVAAAVASLSAGDHRDIAVIAAFVAALCLILGFLVWAALGQIPDGEPRRIPVHRTVAIALTLTHTGLVVVGFTVASLVRGWTAAGSGAVEATGILLALALAVVAGGPALVHAWQRQTGVVARNRNTIAKMLWHVAMACVGVSVVAERHLHADGLEGAAIVGMTLTLAGLVVRAVPRSTQKGMERQPSARYSIARLALTGTGGACLAGAAAGAVGAPGAIAAVLVAAALGLIRA